VFSDHLEAIAHRIHDGWRASLCCDGERALAHGDDVERRAWHKAVVGSCFRAWHQCSGLFGRSSRASTVSSSRRSVATSPSAFIAAAGFSLPAAIARSRRFVHPKQPLASVFADDLVTGLAIGRGDLRDMAGRVFCWHGTPGIEGEAKEDRHANAGGGKGKRPQAAPKQDERARWVWLDTAGNSPMRT